jgi:hypothetical protein
MPTYVIHFCKNKSCLQSWIDLDLTRAKTPPTWKYCLLCLEQGFINPEVPPRNPKISAQSKQKWSEGKLQGKNRGY